MHATRLPIWWVCCLLLLMVACEEADEEAKSNNYKFVKPRHFPAPTYNFDKNPITKEGFELGKKLFFDPLLSKDNSVSCNSCHIQSTAFADAQQHPLSIGVDNRVGLRNAPPLTNLAFMPEFFWDGGVTHLDFVPINAIESPFEMDEKLASVVEKLNANDEYRQLFQMAFSVDEITSPLMLKALSQFMLLMVSANTPYDDYILGDVEALSKEEVEGLSLFRQKCGDCHSGELFTDFTYRNNGLNTDFKDQGRALITESENDVGKFRVPGLRNIARTAPYMHNAMFTSLEQVLDHYDNSIQHSPTLDPTLEKGISLTENEKSKIITFLNTLTDHDFRSDRRFMNQQ
ncbi:cytochrome-c peroxidase [Fulvivirga sp. RKSG066]|uniref:cytochrome-c peroxidase n=1 Tax=Fulvivirga aurantia TaxID=2529383 RepID=UPI0012BC566F|nr:cytochrome c peroxidase [Fulvivirga aurantia]MTI22769.1 cytochrome-c peroxidase [Fulvivirga aurantia]